MRTQHHKVEHQQPNKEQPNKVIESRELLDLLHKIKNPALDLNIRLIHDRIFALCVMKFVDDTNRKPPDRFERTH